MAYQPGNLPNLAALKESKGLVVAMKVALEADEHLSYANFCELPPKEQADARAARMFINGHWGKYQALLRDRQDATS